MSSYLTMKKIIGIFILVLIPFLGFSQNVNVLQNIAKQVQSGQISQQEAVKKAREAGVSIEDFNQLQSKTSSSQQKQVSEADKAAAPSGKKDTTRQDEPAWKTKQDSITFHKQLREDSIRNEYFGYDLFKGPKDKFERTDIGSISPNYQVGPGDELIISMWGQTEMRLKVEVARDGTVFIDQYGQMVVGGLPLQQVENKMIKKLSRMYSGLNPSQGNSSTFLDVSLGELQSFQVFVIGKVENPGSHFVSSYATAFTALYKSGGPKIEGSLRDIRVIRDGEVVSNLDLYNFITSGKRPNDVRLQNNDVIYVPPRLNTVRLRGEVKEEAFYELKEEETLKDLVTYSGGLKTSSDVQKVQIERITSFDQRQKDAEVYKVLKPELGKYENGSFVINDIPLQDKDLVSVMPLTGEFSKDTVPGGVNFVSVGGHVYKPGKYVLNEDMKVKDLLEKAGGLKDSIFWGQTYQLRADLIRYDDHYREREIVHVPLKDLRNGDEEFNLKLNPRDSLIVYDANVVYEEKQVEIYGEVKEPGTYNLETNTSLQDLILRAGGFTKKAYLYNIEVFKLKTGKTKEELSRLHNVEITPDMLQDFDKTDDFELSDYDMVVVRKDPEFEPHRIVRIAGEVKFPGKYPILKINETFSDLIARAGGLKEEAFLPGLRFIRKDSIRVVGDFGEYIDEERKGIVLEENDSIFVPKRPGTVQVSGDVRNPGLVQYNEKWDMGDYVEAAGDYTNEAAKSKTIVYYPGGNAKKKQFLFNPEIKEGSEIFVPRKPEREPVDVTQLLTNWASIATSVATVIYILNR